jgi:hypothetical protein
MYKNQMFYGIPEEGTKASKKNIRAGRPKVIEQIRL